MFKYFIQYVELKTKVASVFPFMFALLFYIINFAIDYEFDPIKAVIFFVAMLALDMATTTLNHQVGMDKEKDISPYDQNLVKQMHDLNLSNKHNYIIIAILATIGIGLGFYLVSISSALLILVGGLCVLVAIAYSYGPVPIKNTCLGEVFSGATMGYLIPLAFFISQDQSIFISSMTNSTISLNYINILIFVITFAIPTLLIANIMLANNICDIDKDINNKRYTLAVMLGQNQAITLWQNIYIFIYSLIGVSIVLGFLPMIAFVSYLTMIPVFKNIKIFKANPIKSETFIMSVKNIVIVLSSLTVLMIISLLF